MAGGVAVVLMLVLAIGVPAQLGWIGLAAGILDAAPGSQGVTHALRGLSGILHAVLAQVFFGDRRHCRHDIGRVGSADPSPSKTPGALPCGRSPSPSQPSFCSKPRSAPAYRYRALGVLWHILNAMIVLLLILIVAVFLIRQFPEHPTLRPAAVALAVITGIQVMLGFTTFMMLILFPETSLAVVITSVLHVATGSLTFGAGMALAILIRYNIGAGRSLTGQ